MSLFGLGKYGGKKKERSRPYIGAIVADLRKKRDSHSKLSNFLAGRNEKLRVAESVEKDIEGGR